MRFAFLPRMLLLLLLDNLRRLYRWGRPLRKLLHRNRVDAWLNSGYPDPVLNPELSPQRRLGLLRIAALTIDHLHLLVFLSAAQAGQYRRLIAHKKAVDVTVEVSDSDVLCRIWR